MKKTLCLILCSLFLCKVGAITTEPADSVRIMEFLPVKHTDNIEWIKRYQHDIDKYADENKAMPDRSCDALFIGSSSINMWHNIYNDLAPIKIIRRSYGGSTIRDMLYNYEVIARGYNPRMIVMYVENDFCPCKEGISVGEVYDLFRIFTQKIQHDYPGVPFYILSFKPSFAKADLLPEQLAINALLADFCQRTENVFFIDITKTMYDREGKLRTDIFLGDKLHLNQTGYDLWTEKIKPVLMEYLKSSPR